MADTKDDTKSSNERLMYCLVHGLPIPDGKSLSPPADGPLPLTSDPSAIERVRSQIADLKSGTFTSYDSLPQPEGMLALIPASTGTWQELNETGKLAVLDFWVDWTGVSQKDRQIEWTKHVVASRLPPEFQQQLRDMAEDSSHETQGPRPDEAREQGKQTATRMRFQDLDCAVTFAQYSNGRVALLLHDADGDELAVATVNVPDVALGANEVLVKDYSENKGMLASLEEAGIVRRTDRTVQSGFVALPVCELLIPPLGKQNERKSSLSELRAEAKPKAKSKSRDNGREM